MAAERGVLMMTHAIAFGRRARIQTMQGRSELPGFIGLTAFHKGNTTSSSALRFDAKPVFHGLIGHPRWPNVAYSASVAILESIARWLDLLARAQSMPCHAQGTQRYVCDALAISLYILDAYGDTCSCSRASPQYNVSAGIKSV